MKIEQDFPWDIFRFIPKSTRDADESGVLERILIGPQLAWEGTVDQIQALKTLHSVDDIDDEWLQLLKWQVGWTSETKLTQITDGLSNDNLRKLIRLSADLWRMKGTELSTADAIRILTGRDVIIRNWFKRRWVLGVARLWMLGSESDPWLTGHSYGDHDEYRTMMWVQLDADIPRQLIRRIVNLARPMQEVVDIGYANLVDDFRFGRARWLTDVLPDVTWDDTHYRLLVSSGTVIRANVTSLESADNVLWRFRCAFVGASGGMVQLEFHRDAGGANDRYIASWQQDGAIKLEVVQGGIPTTLSTTTLSHLFPQDETSILGVTVVQETSTTLRIRVVVYNENVIDEIVSGGQVLDPGQWRIANASVNDILIDDVLGYSLPLTVDQVNGSGEVVG